MIIPLLMIFGIMGYLVINAQQDDFKKMGANTLSSINDNIVNVIYSSVQQQDVAMRNSQYMISMKKLMSHEILMYRDIIFMNSIINYLTSAQISYQYIDSIYLYMDDLDNFLSSSSDDLASFKTFYDTEWFDHYKKMPKENNQFFETRELQKHSYDSAKDVITIYQRMSYAKGVIVLNVKSDDFGERINDMLDPGQDFFYLNKEGEVLYGSNMDSTLYYNAENDFFQKIIEDYNEKDKTINYQEWVKLNKKYYLMNVKSDDYNQSYLVSMFSFDAFSEKLSSFKRLALAILMINILIVMILSWITTRSAFKHITYLVDIFSAAERGEVIGEPQPIVKDEYNLILNNILFLFIKNSQMHSNLIEKQHQNQISEMMALQLQINPHFIFNTLQTMDLEVLKEYGGQSTLHTLIQQLSSIMKYALTNPTELVSLREEMNHLKAYIDIQEVRFNNNIITYYEIDDSLLGCSVFRLMLQPIIENCVQHGIRATKERCFIKIKIMKKGEYARINVIDNGIGMTREILMELRIKINDPSSKNIGLTNLNHRLILHYGETSKLRILSKKDMGTSISFKIPMSELEKLSIISNPQEI